jgi:hypothetical protein
MKLRQKLAMVLAATMVVTAVPVVTMAKSTADITAGSTLVGVKGTELTQSVTLQLSITNQITSGETFYISLSGAEFKNDNTEIKVNKGTATQTSDSDVKVVLEGTDSSSTTKITVTFPANSITLTSSEAKFVIDGAGSSVSDTTVNFATTSTAKAAVSVVSTPTLYNETAKVGAINITEPYANAFYNATKKQTIKIQLKNSDFKFVEKNDSDATKLDLQRGFATVSTKDQFDVKVEENLITITIPAGTQSATAGRIVLDNIWVKSTDKTPSTGDLKVKVSGDNLTAAEFTVGKIASYTAVLSVDDVAEITAGKTEEVTFNLSENLAGSIVPGREIEFTASDNAYFSAYSIDKDTTSVALGLEGIDPVYSGTKVIGYQGFTYEVPSNHKTTDLVDQDFTLKLVTKLTSAAGDVTVTASGSRAIGDDISVVVAKLETPVTVTKEAATLKVGLKGQKAGKITITETEAGMIEKGYIVVKLNGVEFDDEPTVTVTKGDIQLNLSDSNEFTIATASGGSSYYYLYIPVKATSDEASTIEISNLPISVDRTLPEGTWSATVGFTEKKKTSTSLDAGNVGTDDSEIFTEYSGNNYYGTITVKDFIVIGTPNTEDITTSGLTKATSTFVLSQTTYTVNGETKNMDGAAAYASANGRIMAPVRYLADAFGINGNNVIVSGDTITLIAGNRTIQLTVGSKIAVLNGVEIPMDEAVAVTNGRSYAPLSQIAQLLGISYEWDAVNKTVTFQN